MPSISKFLFDTSFDGKGAAAPAPKPVRRNFTAAEMEAEKAKAFAEGHKAGVAEAASDAQARATAAFEKIGARATEMVSQLDRHHADALRSAVTAAVTMTRKLLPALSRREEMKEIETLVVDCLGRLHDEPKIIVRLNEVHVETFRQRLDSLANSTGFSGRVAAVADPSLSPADVRVEWANGGTERDTQQVWQEIEEAVTRFVGSDPAK